MMTQTAPLPSDLRNRVLDFLGVRFTAPDRAFLDALLAAYTRIVPWESASRIARKADTPDQCPAWPEAFWRNAMQHGTGGTCFESNYACFALLRSLGYEGYLTINNMGETIGCHTAQVIVVNGGKLLVDAGMPLHATIPIHAHEVTEQITPFMLYRVRPLQANTYDIEREPHPRSNCFTLIDTPIPDADYRAATSNDYNPGGFFLDKVVINKVVDEQLWRFSSAEQMLHLEQFGNGARTDHALTGAAADVAAVISAKFGIESRIVVRALQVLS